MLTRIQYQNFLAEELDKAVKTNELIKIRKLFVQLFFERGNDEFGTMFAERAIQRYDSNRPSY